MQYPLKQFLPESALLIYTIHCSFHILTMVLLHGVVPTVLIKTDFMSYKSELAVSNSEYRNHSNPLFIKYNQLKISDLCNHNIGIFMYKYCNNLLTSSFNNIFKPNAENHDYNTRNALNFEYPNNKLNFCDKSISYQGAKTWNNIPSSC